MSANFSQTFLDFQPGKSGPILVKALPTCVKRPPSLQVLPGPERALLTVLLLGRLLLGVLVTVGIGVVVIAASSSTSVLVIPEPRLRSVPA